MRLSNSPHRRKPRRTRLSQNSPKRRRFVDLPRPEDRVVRQKSFVAWIPILLFSCAVACAQPAFLSQPAPIPDLPTFRNLTQILSDRQSRMAARRNATPAGLTIDLIVSIPTSPSASNADLLEAATRSIQSLREAFERQCEIVAASFNDGCRTAHFTLNNGSGGRPSAGQVVNANVHAEFEFTSPATDRPKP
jgi:hypothetical protein